MNDLNETTNITPNNQTPLADQSYLDDSGNNSSAKQTKYAGFGRRFLAYSIDYVILYPIILILQKLFGADPFAFLSAQSLEQLREIQAESFSHSILPSLFTFPLVVTFYLVMWVNFDGATPGKKLMAIKVTKNSGAKVTYLTAIIRYISAFLSYLTFFLGILWIIWDKKKQSWHDKIARTVVIETEKKPKVLLGILAIILLIGYLIGFSGLSFYKGIQLGLKAAESGPIESLHLSTEAKAHYDKTQELFKQMQSISSDTEALKPLADQTIKEARLALEIEPNNSLLWSNLGQAYGWPNSISTPDDALNAFKKAEELDPKNTLYMNYVGNQLIRMHRYEEAVFQLQKSLRLNDNSGFAHLSIGKAYKGLKIYDEAEAHFRKSIEIFQAINGDGKFKEEILNAQREIASLPK